MGKKERPMFADFKKLSKKEWANNATSDLKGVDVYEKYRWPLDGILVDPYFDGSDLEKLKNITGFENRLFRNNDPSGNPRVWVNLQKISAIDFKVANKQALEALNSGADGIEFDCKDTSNIDFDVLLSDVKLNYCHISLAQASFEDCNNYISYLSKHDELYDGLISLKEHDDLDRQIQLIDLCIHKNIKCIEITSTEDGFTEQIADLLLLANRKIRSFLLGGLSVESAINAIYIVTKIGTDYFGEIAKIRAIRNLFYQVARAYGHEKFLPEDLHIKCISPTWNSEAYQPNANMLKSSTAAMSAIIGGCDSLLIEPENPESTLSVRIARNTSLVLKEESFFSKTADPVAGSYYLESLTDQLAETSWKIFQNKLEASNIDK